MSLVLTNKNQIQTIIFEADTSIQWLLSWQEGKTN